VRGRRGRLMITPKEAVQQAAKRERRGFAVFYGEAAVCAVHRVSGSVRIYINVERRRPQGVGDGGGRGGRRLNGNDYRR
jgi:hypothetical protein